MASPASFVASPNKRIAAFVFDSVVVTVGLLLVVVTLGRRNVEIPLFASFAACAWLYHVIATWAQHGQTLGRSVQGICVASASGLEASVRQLIVRASWRYFPLAALSIPWQEQVPAEAACALAIRVVAVLLWAREFLLLQGAEGRTQADRLADTCVVNAPPPDTHRAPAAPMFSANDVEFGTPPKVPRRVARVALAPNCSIEATANSRPRYGSCSFLPPRGLLSAAPHVER